jgi:hypothetical protein
MLPFEGGAIRLPISAIFEKCSLDGERRAPFGVSSMTILSLFGLCAVTAGVVFYAMENLSSWFILALGISTAMASVYAFLQGAWPYGLIEIVWTVAALLRWWPRRRGRLNALRSKIDERYARGEMKREKYLQKRVEIARSMANI